MLCLLDLADHEYLAPQDRLTLIRRPQPRAETPFGHKLVALMSERELSLREVARRVPCSPAHLSRVAHGKGISAQLAGLLDRVLDAGGELAALAETPAGEEKRVTRHSEPAGQPMPDAHGLSLSLPYVPGRLVIEVSDPLVSHGHDARDGHHPDPASGQLALVQSLPGHARRDGA